MYHVRPVLVFVFILSIPFICNYFVTSFIFRAAQLSKKSIKVPPTVPYILPILGSSLDLGFNALGFIRSSTRLLGGQTPFGVSLLNEKIYFVQGAENIVSLWKKSTTMMGTPLHTFCLKNLFGMPAKALQMYVSDDSGLHAKPLSGSRVAPHNRVDYRTHVGLLKFTNGTGLEGFYERWASGFLKRLQTLDVGDDWVEMPDFMTFFDHNFRSAVLESICSPNLVLLNPTFAQDFSEYDQAMPGFLKGFPRWMIPASYRVRDKLISSIKRWHDFANRHFNEALVDSNGDADPYFGSACIRERQGANGIFASIDNFDEDACAASDLGFLWAATTNLVPSAMWCTLETFKDPSLLSRVRAELEGSFDATTLREFEFDSQKIQALPLLQSIYAETLRLRVQAYAARYTGCNDLQINQWIVPKKSVILVSSASAHMDENFWNTGNGVHPVDQFWADRFLFYPDDSFSGAHVKKSPELAAAVSSSTSGPKFSMSNTNGSWIPYGGGPRVCIGRAFSKRAMVSTCAIMTTMFDIEILAHESALQMDPKFYGLGGQRPIGKVPFRIKKRGKAS